MYLNWFYRGVFAGADDMIKTVLPIGSEVSKGKHRDTAAGGRECHFVIVLFCLMGLAFSSGCIHPRTCSHVSAPDTNLVAVLKEELATLAEQVREAEENLIEYDRLNNVE
jgi:hypothetical protein